MESKYAGLALDYTKALLSIDSPTGMTAEAEEYVIKTLMAMGYEPVHTKKGGVICCLGGQGEGLLLSSHLDTLGAMVESINPSGTLKATRIGGLNANNVETELVRVYTRDDGILEGTFQLKNASIHVNKDYSDIKRDFDTIEVILDEDIKDAQGARALGVSVGDFICVDPRTAVTKSGYIKSRYLDDKLSCGMLLALGQWIKDESIDLKRKLYIYFTVYEEVGHGASSCIPADVTEAVAVDMGCVGQGLSCTERQISICAKDSSGPYNKSVTDRLVSAARAAGADYAIDVYPYYGSDTGAMLRSGADLRHGLVGAGVYASHGYERSHIDGVLNTLKTLEAFLFL